MTSPASQPDRAHYFVFVAGRVTCPRARALDGNIVALVEGSAGPPLSTCTARERCACELKRIDANPKHLATDAE